MLNPELGGLEPKLKGNAIVIKSPLSPPDLEKQDQRFSSIFGDNVNLEWLNWEGSLPNGAVAIYNSYTQRTDYVCKYNCEAGFYNPGLGPHCRYPYGNHEYYAPKFQILANKDNFEVLQWLGGSYGSVPRHAVRTCPGVGTYVGKNKYGLGKVVPKFKAFFLPWARVEHWYKYYQVLAINRDAYTQHLSDVYYSINEAKLFQYPAEIMRISTITNNECQAVVKTMTISKSTEMQTTWNVDRATMQSISSSITAHIPYISEFGITMGSMRTLTFSQGTTMVEEINHSVSVELKIQPNHSCSVRMEGHKVKVVIPCTARLSRTYRSGQTRSTTITGTYNSVQIGVVRTVVDQCEPVVDAQPCQSECQA